MAQPMLMAQRRVTVRIDLAYDGRPFRGFAENPGVPTVAGTLRLALERVLGHDVEVTGAGRTDAGVHARNQVVSFAADPTRFEPNRLFRSLDRLVAPSIAVRSVAVVDDGFDARFAARSRTYRYHLHNARARDPLVAPFSWHVGDPLDRHALEQGCGPLLGEHDFSAFCRRPEPAPDGSPRTLVRRVEAAGWRQSGNHLWTFEIRANAFCHQMVRSVVGTLVEVGRGRRPAVDVMLLLNAGDRKRTTTVAPPHGLVLWDVTY